VALPDGLDQVAQQMVQLLTSRLRHDPDDQRSFAGFDIDLAGTTLDADFSRARFTGGTVSFEGCKFGSNTSFTGSIFSGGHIVFDGAAFKGVRHARTGLFTEAIFQGSDVSFREAIFSGGFSCFDDTSFLSGSVYFTRITLMDSILSFVRAKFAGADVDFSDALFETGCARFPDCRVTGGKVGFDRSLIKTPVSFERAVIDGGHVSFDEAESASPALSFQDTQVILGKLTLRNLVVSGGRVAFEGLIVDGGSLILNGAVLQFGKMDLGRASFLRGSVSLNIKVKFDSILDLPWARYSSSGASVKDTEFDGFTNYDFVAKVAAYRPGAITNWGDFRP
jgi:hypothetical protein